MNWQELRQQVLERDHYQCQTCLKNKANEVHHIIPRNKKGLNIFNNLVSLCQECHRLLELKSFKGLTKKTVIIMCKDTREKLRRLGFKGESYDTIILRLIKHWEDTH